MTHYDIRWLKEKIESGDTPEFVCFWGHANKYNEKVGKFCFSQWFENPFTVDGITYKTAEHWMMAHKALLFGDTEMLDKIIQCKSPSEAKKLGRQVKEYDDQVWNEHKCEIVRLGNIHKFNQYPEYAAYLIETGSSVIVEASPRDRVWGVGLGPNNKDIENVHAWRGINLLGFTLMEVRDFLREFGHFKELENAVQPPWKQFPSISKGEAFWRMGGGEEYVIQFGKYSTELSDRDVTIYRLTHPAPLEWSGFYS